MKERPEDRGASQIVDAAPRTAAAMAELAIAHTLVHTVQDAAALLRPSYSLALAAAARELSRPPEEQNLDAVFVLIERSGAHFQDSLNFATERLREMRS